jgi:acyl carrier protein
MLERAYVDDAVQVAALPYDLRDLVQFFPTGPGIAFFRDLLGEDIHVLRSTGTTTRLNRRPNLAVEFVAPRTEIEQTIASLWQRALDLERVGVHDSFFDLGGDSVFGTQIVAQVNKTFGISIQLVDALDSFTIAKLAERVEAILLEKIEAMDEQEAERRLRSTNAQ